MADRASWLSRYPSLLEFQSMISGNGVPAASDRDEGVSRASQQLRDIQDLIAKLEDVNRRLSFPARPVSAPRQADAGGAED
jgi:hypothetical protein